jgi:hypothetical protein
MKRVSTGRGSKKTEGGAAEGTTRAGTVQEPRGIEAGAERRTAAGPRAIGTMLDRLVGKAGHRRGFGEARILTEWAAVVGEELAGCTLPERIARSRGAKDGGGVLHLRVQSGWAPSVQHMGPVIVERINRYLGYAAIDRIAMRQGIVAPARRRGPPPRRPLAADERADLEAALRGVDDPDLAAALRALGEAVLAREENRTTTRRDATTPPSR